MMPYAHTHHAYIEYNEGKDKPSLCPSAPSLYTAQAFVIEHTKYLKYHSAALTLFSSDIISYGVAIISVPLKCIPITFLAFDRGPVADEWQILAAPNVSIVTNLLLDKRCVFMRSESILPISI